MNEIPNTFKQLNKGPIYLISDWRRIKSSSKPKNSYFILFYLFYSTFGYVELFNFPHHIHVKKKSNSMSCLQTMILKTTNDILIKFRYPVNYGTITSTFE